MNTLMRWSPAKDARRAVNPDQTAAPDATSIVSTAAKILSEEVQSLATSGANLLLPTLGALANRAQPAQQASGQVRSLADTLSRLVNLPPDRLMQLIAQSGVPAGADDTASEPVRVLRPSRAAAAGNVSRLSLHLENDNPEPDACTLHLTDLIGPSGFRISASHIRVSPQPAHIPGRGSAEIQLEVRIPSETPAGCYTGLLQSDDGEALRALVEVRVGQ